MEGNPETSWHLDKRVPLAWIAVFAIQTITLVYIWTTWKSDIDHRVVQLEKYELERAPQDRRITVNEQRIGFIFDSLKRIEAKLDSTRQKRTTGRSVAE